MTNTVAHWQTRPCSACALAPAGRALRPSGPRRHRALGRRPAPPRQPPGRVDLGGVDAPRVRPRCPRLSPLWGPAAGHRHRAGPGRRAGPPGPRRRGALPGGPRPRPTRPGRDRLACGSTRPERGVPRTGTRLRLAARSLTVPPTPAQDRGVSRRSGWAGRRGSRGRPGEAGGGRTSAPPAEVTLIVPMRSTWTLVAWRTTPPVSRCGSRARSRANRRLPAWEFPRAHLTSCHLPSEFVTYSLGLPYRFSRFLTSSHAIWAAVLNVGSSASRAPSRILWVSSF